jgi:hypothetical protein
VPSVPKIGTKTPSLASRESCASERALFEGGSAILPTARPAVICKNPKNPCLASADGSLTELSVMAASVVRPARQEQPVGSAAAIAGLPKRPEQPVGPAAAIAVLPARPEQPVGSAAAIAVLTARPEQPEESAAAVAVLPARPEQPEESAAAIAVSGRDGLSSILGSGCSVLDSLSGGLDGLSSIFGRKKDRFPDCSAMDLFLGNPR